MADVFDEIDDDIRHEKLKQFWKENGSWIIGGSIGAVLMTGALTFWRQYEYRSNTKATTELSSLITAGDMGKLESFAKATDKNHAVIAQLIAAGTYVKRGETAKAVELYNELADTSGVDKSWRSLAKLLSIAQRLDSDKPETLTKELAEIAGDKSAWRYSAREMQALLAARQNKMQEAVDILTALTADPQAPSDIRTRAFTLRELYVAEIKPEKKTLEKKTEG